MIPEVSHSTMAFKEYLAVVARGLLFLVVVAVACGQHSTASRVLLEHDLGLGQHLAQMVNLLGAPSSRDSLIRSTVRLPPPSRHKHRSTSRGHSCTYARTHARTQRTGVFLPDRSRNRQQVLGDSHPLLLRHELDAKLRLQLRGEQASRPRGALQFHDFSSANVWWMERPSSCLLCFAELDNF